ncbi:MAG: hypothetical protein MO852_16450, partial [Candidatus Devosia euplotis]|nr:hypothetical protein [Candidatus Devosia euplotis]
MSFAAPALARPGTHAPAISTWDTRASSVAFHAKLGFLPGGHFRNYSYNANFTSTSGNLSAQFGLHYLTLNRGPETDEQSGQETKRNTQHGASASATGLLSIPFTGRTDNGIPTAAIGIYFGAVPALLTSGNLNDLTIPLVLGLGVPYSPHK